MAPVRTAGPPPPGWPPRDLLPPSPGVPPQASPPALVGRDTELARLHACVAQVRHGVRQTVFVTGEAGSGKTTLVEAFVSQLGGAEALWLGHGQCIEHYGAGEGYLPVLEALGRLGRAPGARGWWRACASMAPTWLVQLPAL